MTCMWELYELLQEHVKNGSHLSEPISISPILIDHSQRSTSLSTLTKSTEKFSSHFLRQQ